MAGAKAETPNTAYAAHLDRHQRDAARHAARESRLSSARLAVFAAGVVIAWFSLGVRTLHPAWLLPPVAIFVSLVVFHDRVIRRREHADRAVAYYQAGLTRLLDPLDPAGSQHDGSEFANADHPYAADLDLFGPASLFATLCRARSRAGIETLARWLSKPAEGDEIRARQAAVAELASRPELRESLALIDVGTAEDITADRFIEWSQAPAHGPTHWVRRIAAVLSACSVLALAGGAVAFGTGAIAFASPLLAAQAIFFGALSSRRREILASVEQAAGDLSRLSKLLEQLENAEFESPRLVALRRAIDTDGLAASRQLARLRRLIDLCDARRNQMYWVPPIGPILGIVSQAAFGIEAWRQRVGSHASEWIRAVGEFEALASLATQAYEHPDDVFPEIEDQAAIFDGQALGHPLLADGVSVRNDVALGHECQALVVSGSNMSGKSTLLRTVGSNAVLALAGAPVRARRLRIGPLHVGASIRVQDSLREGASRFYAEIRRVAQVVEATEGSRPVLFILDEIFHGTNSHDRRIGAEAIVRTLVERHAIGLVTTHDLALAKVADALAPRVRNVHFEDQLEEGRIHFDYHMREGVITRSNALALMRAVGLDVPDDA